MSVAQLASRPWRYADLVALPEDQLRHELIDGEHLVTPSPGTPHQLILWNLSGILWSYLRANPIGTALAGPFDVRLSLFTVLVPDLVYFTADRFIRVVNEKHAIAAPDLVVEVLSPGTRRRDRGRKRAVYDREGVQEYWIIDPEAQSIAVLRRPCAGGGLTDVTRATAAAADVLASPLFPGLRISLRDVFRGR